MSFATFIQKLPIMLLAIVAASVTYQLATLTWALVPTDAPRLSWEPSATVADNRGSTVNTSTLQQLFGEKVQQGTAQQDFITDAPKTRLKLKLVGIVAASDVKYSSVIIERNSQQHSYFLGSKIDGTRATITQIYRDRIILMLQGEEQTLLLEGGSIDNVAHIRKSVPNSRTKKKSKRLNIDRKALLANPGSLTDYIRISPVRKGGVIKGYRVKPGKNKSFFKEAGLKSGDLAVELNGVDLTDTEQAFTLMKEFSTMTEITLSVERDGQLYELDLSIP